MKRHQILATVVLITCLIATPCLSARYTLPDISDPSYATLSVAEEKKLGEIIRAQLRSQLPIIQDIEIQSYLRNLGERLLSHVPYQPFDFYFFPVRNDSINAFATPGGVIAINHGLILFADNESELAGVIAHEISHVTHRHLARLQALSQETSWVGILSIIGALLASAYNSDLATLSLFGGTALPVDRQLSYTRDFEYEADRFGMQLIADSGLDPSGIPNFFSKLQSQEARRQAPEFLRTHPLTLARLSDARARANQYQGTYKKDSDEFRYMKAKILALKNAPLSDELDQQHIKSYYQAMSLIQKQLPLKALDSLKKIPPKQHTLPIKLAFVQTYIALENWKKAITLLDELNGLHPNRVNIKYYLVLCLIKNRQARQALTQINAVSRLHKYYPQFYKLGAQAAIELNRTSDYHEYLSDYYASRGQLEAALSQLKLAERSQSLNQVSRARIAVKRKKINALKEDMRR